MAYRKVDEASLYAVADAIRERSGGTKVLAFPGEMVSAIYGIPDKQLDLLAAKKLTEYRSNTLGVIDANVFNGNNVLEKVWFPALTRCKSAAFQNCTELTTADMGNISRIETNTFRGTKFSTLILRKNSVVTLAAADAFLYSGFTGNSGGTGTLYCPAALIESYKTATNWSTMYEAGTCNFVALEGSEYE